MFGLGLPEIIFIFVLAALILGPEHMPRAARMIGKWSAKMRSAATSFTQAVTEDADISEIKSNLNDVRREIESAKNELSGVTKEVSNIGHETHEAFEDAKQELKAFQASTGRDNDRENDGVEPQPGASFMDRPMSGLSSTESHKTLSSCIEKEPCVPVLRSIRLSPHTFLPGAESHQVSKKRIALCGPEKGENNRSVSVSKPAAFPGFCIYRSLPAPVRSDNASLKSFVLSQKQKSEP